MNSNQPLSLKRKIGNHCILPVRNVARGRNSREKEKVEEHARRNGERKIMLDMNMARQNKAKPASGIKEREKMHIRRKIIYTLGQVTSIAELRTKG